MRKKEAVEPVPKGLSDLTFEHVCVTCNRNGNRSTTLGEFNLLLKQCDEHHESTKVINGGIPEGGQLWPCAQQARTCGRCLDVERL